MKSNVMYRELIIEWLEEMEKTGKVPPCEIKSDKWHDIIINIECNGYNYKYYVWPNNCLRWFAEYDYIVDERKTRVYIRKNEMDLIKKELKNKIEG